MTTAIERRFRRKDKKVHYNRGLAHFGMKAYDQAWSDVKMCRKLGGKPAAAFLDRLSRESGRSE
jgi:hypothetical protein